MSPTDQAARARLTSDLDTTFFVEAGAGTGKTRELVARVVALVATGRLNMDGLAAITFTDAAAAELRDRIRRELAQAALDTHLGAADDRLRCLEASRNVDQAHIQTIHAFAGDLLRTFPLEAELPPGFEIWDEMRRDRDFDERFRAWLYDEVPRADNALRRDAVARVLALGLPPDRLKLLAQRLQEQYDLLRSNSTWERGDAEDAVQVANESGAALQQLEPLLAYGQLLNEDGLVKEVRPLAFTASRLATASTEPEAYEALLRYWLNRPNPMRSNPHLWDEHPTLGNPHSLIRQTLQSINARVEQTLADHRGAALADLLGYLAEFTLAYARDRKSRGVATFHDLLVWSRDLLRDNPAVREAAHDRFQRLFVDEFQDTDPLQAELVAYLTADPCLADQREWTTLLDHLVPGKLFVVGDPKQSIYRFRRADVAVYQRVYQASTQPGAARASLAQTFRSVEPLVDWVNEHFGAVMHEEVGVQAAYASLEARPDLPGVDLDLTACGVRTVGGPDDRKAGDRWTAEADTIARLARKAVLDEWPVSEQIDSEWHVRPAGYRDICVLLPTRTNLRRLERAFEQNGVPYRMESGSLVVFTQEVRDLVACLRAIEDPSDQVALVATLKSPAYACSDIDLLGWLESGGQLNYLNPGVAVEDSSTLPGNHGSSPQSDVSPLECPPLSPKNPVGSALSSLMAFHVVRNERSAAATVEALIRDRGLAILALDHPRPREALRRQRYVVAQARKLASAGDPTLRGFVHWIETLRKNEMYDAESAVPDSDENAVRLKTIHGAKGLEFPIVILSGLGGGARPNDGVQLLANHTGTRPNDGVQLPAFHTGIRPNGGVLVPPSRARPRVEARITARIGPAFATIGFDIAREKRLAEAEQLRLLYVAATRAREHLVLCLFHSSKGAGKSSPAAAIYNRLPALTTAHPTQISLTDLATLPLVTDPPVSTPMPPILSPEEHAQAEADWQQRRQTLLDTLGQERHVTPSALAHEPEPPDFAVGADADFAPAPTRAHKAATALGIAVHSVLQGLDLESLSNLADLAAWSAAEQGVDPAEVAHLASLAAQSDPVRRAVASGRRWREVPLTVSINGVLLEGAIDLLYQDPDGALVVVDYKTDHVPPARLAARVDQYRAQGEAYALALFQATNLSVSRIEFIFVAASPNQAEVMVIDHPDIDRASAAIAQASR